MSEIEMACGRCGNMMTNIPEHLLKSVTFICHKCTGMDYKKRVASNVKTYPHKYRAIYTAKKHFKRIA